MFDTYDKNNLDELGKKAEAYAKSKQYDDAALIYEKLSNSISKNNLLLKFYYTYFALFNWEKSKKIENIIRITKDFASQLLEISTQLVIEAEQSTSNFENKLKYLEKAQHNLKHLLDEPRRQSLIQNLLEKFEKLVNDEINKDTSIYLIKKLIKFLERIDEPEHANTYKIRSAELIAPKLSLEELVEAVARGDKKKALMYLEAAILYHEAGLFSKKAEMLHYSSLLSATLSEKIKEVIIFPENKLKHLKDEFIVMSYSKRRKNVDEAISYFTDLGKYKSVARKFNETGYSGDIKLRMKTRTEYCQVYVIRINGDESKHGYLIDPDRLGGEAMIHLIKIINPDGSIDWYKARANGIRKVIEKSDEGSYIRVSSIRNFGFIKELSIQTISSNISTEELV